MANGGKKATLQHKNQVKLIFEVQHPSNPFKNPFERFLSHKRHYAVHYTPKSCL